MPSTQFITLASGLRIAFEISGEPAGTPVFFFHGWPASRLQGTSIDAEAREMGVRVISPDRPGIGLSSYQAGRELLDWPPVVREIAEQLGIARFRVLAVSGGGPYALATAFALPERVEAVAVVSGAPPLGPDSTGRDVLTIYRGLLAAYRMQPRAFRWLFRSVRPFVTVRPPRWAWPLLLRAIPAADRGALRDSAVFAGSIECYREAWRGRGFGVVADAEVYARPWGFDLEKVRTPVRLWHGKKDRSFSWRLAEDIAKRLPNCTARFVEDEGHFSLSIRRRREILEDLMNCEPSLAL